MELIRQYIKTLENSLARQDWQREPTGLYDPIHYVMSLGGKRLRPALCLAACELAGGEPEEALKPALGLEIFHNFTLVHDDIMDKARLRRGRATVHEKWNTNTAILAGDAMLVQSFLYIARVKPVLLPAVHRSFSQAALSICEGQQYDMAFETQSEVGEKQYLEMIRLKTSVLLGCALEVGALIGGTTAANARQLYSFGENIGTAFQIKDDWLDSFGHSDQTGKATGGDIINDKKTLLLIVARQKANNDQRARLEQSYSTEEEKIKAYQEVYRDTGAEAYTRQKMEDFYREALAVLDQVRGKEALKDELKSFAQWLIEREA